MMDICIAGKNQIAINVLKFFFGKCPHANFYIVPSSTDNGRDGWQPSLRKYAVDRGFNVVDIDKVKAIYDLIFLSVEFDKIIKPCEFSTNRLFNIHFSMLPKYRGVYTSVWPILFGDSKAGVSLHLIDDGIDTGELIGQLEFDVGDGWCSKQMYLAYMKNGFLLIKNSFGLICGDLVNIKTKKQKSVGASYFSRKSIDFSSLCVDFNCAAIDVVRQVKAFSFREYQLLHVADCVIVNAEVSTEPSVTEPGCIVQDVSEYLVVAAQDYNVFLYKDKLIDFFEACRNGDFFYVEGHVKNISYIDDRNEYGKSALMLAMENNNIRIGIFLVESGADCFAVDYTGNGLSVCQVEALSMMGSLGGEFCE